MMEELKHIPLFREVDHQVLEQLIREKQMYKRSYHKGTTVHEQNTNCDGMDVVCSGKLVAYSLATNGSETVVFAFEAGSLIGANLLFAKQNRYPMNIYCTDDCTLLHVTEPGVKELLKQYGFVMRFVQSLSMNSQGMNQRIAMYTQKSLRENLMGYLLALSAEQRSDIVVLPVAKKQLADYFGVQRPSLFRELKRMKEEGLIEVANREITVRF